MAVHLVILGLASAFSPIALAVVLMALASPRPGRLLGAYLAGGWVTSVVAGIVVIGALEGLGVTDVRFVHTVSPGIDIAIGVAGLAIAAALELRRRERRGGRRRSGSGAMARLLARATPRALFVSGLLMGFPGIYYVAALKEIAQGNAQWSVRLALMAFVNVLAFVLIWIPLAAYLISPAATRRVIGGIDEWLVEHGGIIITVVIAAAGVYEIAHGLSRL